MESVLLYHWINSCFLCIEARDEYDDDFDRMREATLKSRQEKAKEELAEVTKNVELMKKNLAAAKEQVSRNKNTHLSDCNCNWIIYIAPLKVQNRLEVLLWTDPNNGIHCNQIMSLLILFV